VYSPSNYSGGGFVIGDYLLGPGVGLFRVLDNMAKQYAQYRFESILIKFAPTSATNTTGQVGLFHNTDPTTILPSSSTAFKNEGNNIITNVWKPVVLSAKNQTTQNLYIPHDFTSDKALANQQFHGIFGYMLQGVPDSVAPKSYGQILIEYSIVMFNQAPQESYIAEYDLIVGSGQSIVTAASKSPSLQGFLPSATTPGLYKWMGGDIELSLSIEASSNVDEDVSIATLGLPTNPLGGGLTGPGPSGVVQSFSNTLYTHPNVWSIEMYATFRTGQLLQLPTVTFLGTLRWRLLLTLQPLSAATILDF